MYYSCCIDYKSVDIQHYYPTPFLCALWDMYEHLIFSGHNSWLAYCSILQDWQASYRQPTAHLLTQNNPKQDEQLKAFLLASVMFLLFPFFSIILSPPRVDELKLNNPKAPFLFFFFLLLLYLHLFCLNKFIMDSGKLISTIILQMY